MEVTWQHIDSSASNSSSSIQVAVAPAESFGPAGAKVPGPVATVSLLLDGDRATAPQRGLDGASVTRSPKWLVSTGLGDKSIAVSKMANQTMAFMRTCRIEVANHG